MGIFAYIYINDRLILMIDLTFASPVSSGTDVSCVGMHGLLTCIALIYNLNNLLYEKKVFDWKFCYSCADVL